MLKRLALVVASVGISGIASADALDAAVKKAVREYAAGSYKKAVATLKKVVERGGDVKKRALAYRLLGASYASINKEGDATAAFRKAIELDPEEGLDPNRYPPSVVDLFVAVKAKMRGKLTIKCDREDAQVEIDGKPAGKCGEAHDVPSGARKVVVTSKGKSQERTIQVAVDGSVTEEMKFGPSTGKITIHSVPPGATVTIGEKAIGKTPIENHELDGGEYWVVIALTGFAPVREKLVIDAGDAKALVKTLEKAAETTTTTVVAVPPKTTTTTTTTATPPKTSTTTTALVTTPPKTTTTTTVQTPSDHPAPSRWKRTLGWTLAGLGVAALINGGVFGILTQGAKSDGNAASNQAEYDSFVKDANRFSTVANVSLIAGGVMAAAGVVFIVLDVRSLKKSVALGVAGVHDARGAMTPMLSGTWRF